MSVERRPSRLFDLGRLIVAAVAPRNRREAIEGDLIELWQQRRADGRRDLRRAYVRDLAGLVAARHRRPSRPGRDISLAQQLRGGLAVWMDVRHALRVFRRQPVFTAAAVLTLTLGIAASTAIFTAVDRLLLRPLPYPSPERVMQVERAPIRFGSGPALGEAFRKLDVFAGAGVYAPGGVNLEGGRGAVRLAASVADDGFFKAMAVAPLLGRPMPAHDAEGYPRFAVLAYDTWTEHFGGDRSVVGTSISLNGQPFTVAGVMPPGFRFPGRTGVWLPPGADMQITGAAYAPTVVARLAPDVTIARARAALASYDDARKRAPADRIAITPLTETLTDDVRPLLWFLTASVALLLVVVCTNVANLLLSRVAVRGREFIVRRALGSSRWRLVRQMLIESLLLAATAALAGTVLAAWTLRSISVLAPDTLGDIGLGAIDGRLAAIAIGVAVATAVIFGLAPGAAAAARSASDIVRSGRDDGASPGWRRFRSGLVITQMAAALLLLTASAAAVGALVKVARIDLGFHGGRALGMIVTLPLSHYEIPQVTAFFERAAARLSATPGVRRVGATGMLPGSRDVGVGLAVAVADRPQVEGAAPIFASYLSASADYFTIMGIPVLQGRAFTNADRAGAPPVTILGATTARTLFGSESPVGRRVTIGRRGADNRPYEVVGVVADVLLRGPDADRRTVQQAYVSLLQSPPFGNLSFVLEIDGDPAAIAPSMRASMRDVDAAVPVYDIHTIDAVVDGFLASHRLALTLVAGFAVVTVLVAAIGLYGLTAQLVAQRSREIGLRIALGADPIRVWRGIVAHGVALAVLGSIAGAIAAYFGMRLFAAHVPGLDGFAPGVVAGNAVLLALVATLATWVPASRAARINPVDAIRAEG